MRVLLAASVLIAVLLVAPAAATAHHPNLRIAATPRTISPDGDGTDDVARVRFRIARASYVTTTIHSGASVVRRLRPARIRPGLRTVSWDGTAADGTEAASGRYTMRVAIRDPRRRWRFLTAEVEVAAKAPPTPVDTSKYLLAWPLAGDVTSGFGMRGGRMHEGIDIPAKPMTPIGAAAAGTVRFAGIISGYGNTVIVDHESGHATLYAHQAQVAVTKGTVVTRGQLIGYVGRTGSTTTDHLHLELHDPSATPVDPRPFLPPR